MSVASRWSKIVPPPVAAFSHDFCPFVYHGSIPKLEYRDPSDFFLFPSKIQNQKSPIIIQNPPPPSAPSTPESPPLPIQNPTSKIQNLLLFPPSGEVDRPQQCAQPLLIRCFRISNFNGSLSPSNEAIEAATISGAVMRSHRISKPYSCARCPMKSRWTRPFPSRKGWAALISPR